MTAVFLAYAPADRDLASRVIRGLTAAGIEAWWDEAMPGVDWRQALERQAGELGAIIALWTPAAREDASIKDAARLALPTGKLLNVTMGGASAPFPYGSGDCVSLDDWNGENGHAGWTTLVEMVRTRLNSKGDASSSNVPATTESNIGLNPGQAETSKLPANTAGGESHRAPVAKSPGSGAGPQERDIHAQLAETANRWQSLNQETMWGTGARRVAAVVVACVGVFIGWQMFVHLAAAPRGPSGEWMIPVGILVLAGFLWKGWN
jgi:hypothetical protein